MRSIQRSLFVVVAVLAAVLVPTSAVAAEAPPTAALASGTLRGLAGWTVKPTVTLGGDPAPTVQWETAAPGSSVYTDVVGATEASLLWTLSSSDGGRRFRARATNSAGTVTSAAATVTLTGIAPVFHTQPAPVTQTVPTGTSVTFDVAVNDPGASLAWQVDGVPIPGATGTSFTVTATELNSNSAYSVVATNSVGTTTSTAARVIVEFAPFVQSDVGNRSIEWGASNTTMSAVAYAFPRPTVTWERQLPGATTWTVVSGPTLSPSTSNRHNPSLPVSSTCTLDGARYRVTVANALGTVTSQPGTLSVNCRPVVRSHPLNRSVYPNLAATFTATASGSPTPTAQWQESSDGGATWIAIPGATATTATTVQVGGNVNVAGVSTTYSPPTPLEASGRQYRAVFTNSRGSAPSVAGTLTVNPDTLTISQQPRSSGNLAGTTVRFYTEAKGTRPSTVTWEVAGPGSDVWTPLPTTGQQLLSAFDSYTHRSWLDVVVAAGLDGNRYRASFSALALVATTNEATLTVAQPPVITQAPAVPATANPDGSVTVGVTAAGDGTLTYSWRRGTWQSGFGGGLVCSALTVDGETGATFAFLPLVDRPTCIIVAVSSEFGTVSSSPLTVAAAAPVAAYLLTDPTSVTAEVGTTATFSCGVRNAADQVALAISWQRSEPGGGAWAEVPGTSAPGSSSQLAVDPAIDDDGARYRCRVSNAWGDAYTADALLTVPGVAPSVTSDPVDVSTTAGSVATFSATASGAPTPTVQWERSTDGGTTWTDVVGATSTTLTLTAVVGSLDGSRYRARFTNRAGDVASASAQLTVQGADSVPPTLSLSPGSTATFGIWASPLTVDLTATDELSGVTSIEYSTSGAQATGPTTVGGPSTTLTISTPGTTTITATATDAAGNTSAPATLTVRVDPRPVLAVGARTTTVEPDDGTTRGSLVTLQLDRTATADVVVSYYTQNGSATGCASGTCDYTTFGTPLVPRTATIKAGQRQVVVGVPVRSDAAVEAEESFDVVVLGATNAVVTDAARVATVTIVDADAPAFGGASVLAVTPALDTIEGDDGTTRAQLYVTLSRALTTPVTLTYSTVDGTATAPDDYSAQTSRTLTLPAGTLSRTIDLTVSGDTASGPNRSFTVTHIATGTGFVDLSGPSTITIVDDDRP